MEGVKREGVRRGLVEGSDSKQMSSVSRSFPHPTLHYTHTHQHTHTCENSFVTTNITDRRYC